MPRLDLWESRLAEVIMEAQEAEFSWGTHDCGLFAAKAIAALTGQDPATAFRGKYADEKKCLSLLKRAGGLGKVMAVAAAKHGWKTVEKAYAQRGDVVLAEINGSTTLGVCIGTGFAFAQQPRGLAVLPFDSSVVRTVWRIG